MHTLRPHGRGRLVAAIVVSLSLHALIGVGWFFGPTPGSAGGSSIEEVVNGPDDAATTIVLRDPPTETVRNFAPRATEVEPPAPDPLPKSVMAPPPAGIGAVTPIGGSTGAPAHLPKSVGSRAIHGSKSGKTVVYVLDRSSSMGPDGVLERAVEAVQASLTELGPDTRFQIIAYNSAAIAMAAQPVATTEATRDQAAKWMMSLTAEGKSGHKAAFHEALSMRPDEVYLLTDADDLEESDVRAIAALLRTPVRLSAAVFGGHRPAGATPLERLVERTGGSVRHVGP